MLHHDPTNEVTVNVTVPVTLQPGDPFMVNTSNGVVVPNVPWADHKWLNAAAELQDTIVVRIDNSRIHCLDRLNINNHYTRQSK